MRPFSKWISFVALLLALMACGPLSLVSPSSTALAGDQHPQRDQHRHPPPLARYDHGDGRSQFPHLHPVIHRPPSHPPPRRCRL